MKKETVVITGASAGLGRAIACEFGKTGAQVALLARGQAGLDAAKREIEAAGGAALALPTDVSDAAAVEAAAAAAEREFGTIDIWINGGGGELGAGLGPGPGPARRAEERRLRGRLRLSGRCCRRAPIVGYGGALVTG